ncbi:MAG: HAD family hydrolase [Ruminococcaceae bacterium]|nr:HAD family hydrolase [Oscillospiraceae bacterium]
MQRKVCKMTKICIFDLDGTLLDTLDNIGGNMNRTLADFDLAPFAREDYRYFVGNGSRRLTECALEARGKLTPDFFEEFYPHFMTYYAASPDEGVRVYDGIPALLSALKERGVRVAVCTNKPNAAAQGSIARFFPGGTFDDIIGAVDGMPLKPSPHGVLTLLEKYGFSPDEAAFIGDSDVDMMTAKAASTRGFGALWGFRTAEELAAAGATALLSYPTDLLNHI